MKLMRQQTLALEPDTKIHSESIKLLQMMNNNYQRKEDLDIIYNKLQRLSYFNQFVERFFKVRSHENILTFCSHLRMEHFFAGDVIFEEGDPSNDKLYIIYSGSVLLFRRKPVEQLQQDLKKDFEMRKRILTEDEQTPTIAPTQLSIKYIVKMKFLVNKFARKTRKSLSAEERQNLEMQYGPVLRTMIRGEGFGDKAILENTARTLTIAASTGHLFLVVLKKENFADLKTQFEQEMKEKKKIIFSVFQNIKDEYSTARLETIFYSFESLEYDRNQVIYNEEETGENFYIIQRGEVTLSKKFLDETKNPPQQQLIYICTLGPSHLLGEEILINKNGVYETTACVSSQNTTLMIVSYNEFHTKFPEECRQQILRGYKIKSSNRQKMFQRMYENRLKTNLNYSSQNIKIDSLQQILQLSNLNKGKEGIQNQEFKFLKIKNPYDEIKSSQFFSRKDLIPNQMKISNDLELQFWNPTLTQYCIKTIVENQFENQEKTLNTKNQLTTPSSQINGPDLYDFGKEKPEDRKKKQHLFDLKMNTKQMPKNYIKQNQLTFQTKIKKEYSRVIRKKKNTIHIDPVLKNSFIISSSIHDNSQFFVSNKSQTFNKSTFKLPKDSFQSQRFDTFQSETNKLFITNKQKPDSEEIKNKLDVINSSRSLKKNYKSFQQILNQAK